MQFVGNPGLAKLWVLRECDVSCWNGTSMRPPNKNPRTAGLGARLADFREYSLSLAWGEMATERSLETFSGHAPT